MLTLNLPYGIQIEPGEYLKIFLNKFLDVKCEIKMEPFLYLLCRNLLH